MKLTNRAKSALATAGYSVAEESAMAQLVAFAAQNSGIELRNYYDPADRVTNPRAWRDGWRSFQAEGRSITADWRRFKCALIEAANEGVTDADIIAEAPRAYSGRLEWHEATGNKDCERCRVQHFTGNWEYTVGQYFPTEYRKAAATLLEYATRRVRQARPPESQVVSSIHDLKLLNRKNGGCWFEPSTMRFFGTRIESGIIAKKYFITSEQPPHGSRAYSVRSFDAEGSVDTVGEFCAHSTKAEAMAALRAHLMTPEEVGA